MTLTGALSQPYNTKPAPRYSRSITTASITPNPRQSGSSSPANPSTLLSNRLRASAASTYASETVLKYEKEVEQLVWEQFREDASALEVARLTGPDGRPDREPSSPNLASIGQSEIPSEPNSITEASDAETDEPSTSYSSFDAGDRVSQSISSRDVVIPSTKRRHRNRKNIAKPVNDLDSSEMSYAARNAVAKKDYLKREPSPAFQPSTNPSSSHDAFVENQLLNDGLFLAELRTFLQSQKRKRRSSGSSAGTRRRLTTPKFDSSKSAVSGNALTALFSDLGNVPLLRRNQEVQLAEIIVRGNEIKRAATDLARSLGSRPSLSQVAKAANLPSAQSAARAIVLAEEARNLMVDFNMRMVISVAKRYCGNGLDFCDLIPEGIDGLRKAIDKFDPSKGFKFSTYSHWWIRQAITRSISEQGRDIRLPVHVHEFLTKYRREVDALQNQPDRETKGPVTNEEVAEVLGLSVQKVEWLLRASRTPKRPDDFMSSAGNAGSHDNSKNNLASKGKVYGEELWNSDEDEMGGYVSPEQDDADEYLRNSLTTLLNTLPPRERNVLRLRLGMATVDPRLLEEALRRYKTQNRWNSGLTERAEQLTERWKKTGAVTPDGSDDSEANGLSLTDLGALYQLSKERIRQIESDAMSRLKAPWRMHLICKMKSGEPINSEALDWYIQLTKEATFNTAVFNKWPLEGDYPTRDYLSYRNNGEPRFSPVLEHGQMATDLGDLP